MNREYEEWEKWILAEIKRLGGNSGQLHVPETGLINIQLATERLAHLKGMKDSERALRLSKWALGVSIAAMLLSAIVAMISD